ncbi:MAG: GAF domain-containing sensor histidine kinase [Actinobacteria bacterium]|nr:MAG: GAF domain-containing sensor histidine kinase [Actinomycetota bacterium]
MSTDFVLGDDFARVLTETTQALVCVLDGGGRILDAREVVIPPEESEAFADVLAYIWKTGLSSPQVGHWQAKDGERRLIAWSNKLMPAVENRPSYLVTTGIDLSDRATEVEGALVGDVEAKLVEISRLAQEQRALRRVATLVASEATPERVFTAVSEESARVLEVNASAVFRYEGDDTASVVGRHDRDGVGVFRVGDRIMADDNTAIGRARDSGLPARIQDYYAIDTEVAKTMRGVGYRSTVAAPIFVGGVPWGAVAIAASERLPADSEARLMAFCELVSLAVASAQAREDLQSSRARIVKAGDEQRRKLERNLHDGAQQRLVSLALTLRLARAKLGSGPEALEPLLAGAAAELDKALEELRELARGLHPAALTDQGLGPALRTLAERLPVEVKVDALEERLPDHLEATAYYICSEALTNVAKHAQATHAEVSFEREGDVVRFEISDDGRGGADPRDGSGILGLRDRAEAAGGTLFVISPPGRGTFVTGTLPLSDSA